MRKVKLTAAIAAAFLCVTGIGLPGSMQPANDVYAAVPETVTDGVVWNGHTYKAFDESMTWDDAQKKCTSLGGHLVSIGSSKEQKTVRQLIRFGEKESYWIGLRRDSESSSWNWVDGTRYSFKNFGEGTNSNYGNENYVSVFSRNKILDTDWDAVEGKWDDNRADASTDSGSELSTKGFICEWDSKLKVSSSATTDKTVTLMFYMCGSNLVEQDCRIALDELISSHSGKSVNIIIQTGGAEEWNIRGIAGDRNQRYLVSNKKFRLIDDTVGQKNMGDADTLSDFIKFCKKNYPADRYALIMMDHGGAVDGLMQDANFEDAPEGNLLTLPEFRTALKNSGVHFDFIGTDCCLMANYETALSVGQYCDYLIGCEAYQYVPGWNFKEWIPIICKDTGISTTRLGKIIIDGYCDSQLNEGSITDAELIDTTAVIRNVRPALNKFCKEMDSKLTAKNFLDFAAKRYEAEVLSVTSSSVVDMYAIADNVSDSSASTSLKKALDKAIVYSNKTAKTGTINGLSMYMPRIEYLSRTKSALDVYKACGLQTTSQSKFVKHYSNILAGALNYYTGGDLNSYIESSDRSWLNKKQFFSNSSYKKFIISKAGGYVDIEYTKEGAPKLSLEGRMDKLTTEWGTELWLIAEDKFVKLGTDYMMWINDDETFAFSTANVWYTLNGKMIPIEKQTSGTNEGFNYRTYSCLCKYKGDLIALQINELEDPDTEERESFLIGYYYVDENGDSTGTIFPITKGMKVTPLFYALDSEGNSIYVDQYTMTLKEDNTVERLKLSFPEDDQPVFLCRLQFTDIFGLDHTTDYCVYDATGKYYGMYSQMSSSESSK